MGGLQLKSGRTPAFMLTRVKTVFSLIASLVIDHNIAEYSIPSRIRILFIRISPRPFLEKRPGRVRKNILAKVHSGYVYVGISHGRSSKFGRAVRKRPILINEGILYPDQRPTRAQKFKFSFYVEIEMRRNFKI